MAENQYITPTKENPIFKAHCSDFGYIEQEFYKCWEIRTKELWLIGNTFSTNLTNAIVRLHEFMKSYEPATSKTKYEIFFFDGTIDKYGNSKEIKVYSITEANARKWKLK